MDSEHQGTRHPAGHFISFLENLYKVNFSSIPTVQTRMLQPQQQMIWRSYSCTITCHRRHSQQWITVQTTTYSLLFHASSLKRSSSFLDLPISTRCLEVTQETMQMEMFLPCTALWTGSEFLGAMKPTYKSSSTIDLPSLFLCLPPGALTG